MDIYSSYNNKRGFKSSTSFGSKETSSVASWNTSDPSKYLDKYGKLSPVSSTSRKGLFASGRAMHDTPLVIDRSNEVLPGAYSFDPDFLSFIDRSVDDLNNAIKPDIDDDGFARTSCIVSFDQLRCVSGMYQTPMSYIMVDNDRYRTVELGLKSGLTERQITIARWILELVFSDYEVENVKVPKNSTGGMRRFTSDAQWKIDYAKYVMQPSNKEKILNLIAQSDPVALANDFEMVIARYGQKRGQIDSVGKARWSADKQYALSGGSSGEMIPASKDVVINGVRYDKFSPMRARMIQAYPWTVNSYVQLIFNGHLKSLFKRFPKTFSVNTDQQLKSTFDGHHIVMSDVSNFDNSFPAAIFELMFEAMRKVWDERLVKLVERVVYAPYFTRPLSKDGRKGEWINDPFDWNVNTFAGNGSGWGGTSFIAKVGKQIETAYLVDQVLNFRGKEDIVRYWNHELPIITVNNGDDEGTGSKSKVMFDRFNEVRNDPAHAIFDVSPELGHVYSGHAMVKPKSDELVYFPQQRLHVPLERIFVPERGIGTHLRKFWPIGMSERLDQLSTTDEGREALNIINFNWSNSNIGRKCGSLAYIMQEAHRKMGVDFAHLNFETKLLMINPDALHYKSVNLANVDGSILDQIYSNIPAVEVNTFVSGSYAGSIHYNI